MIRRTRPFLLPLVVLLALLSFAPPARASENPALYAEWQLAAAVYKFSQTLPLLPLQARVARTLSIDIEAPLDHVFEVYSEIDNHIGRHPFLKDVVTHAEYLRDGVHVRNFTAIEDVPLAGITIRNHTHAQQRIHQAQYYYESDTYTAPDVITHQVVRFVDLGDGRTRVTEQLVFQTNLLLIDFTVQNGVASHELTMQRLKADLESGVL